MRDSNAWNERSPYKRLLLIIELPDEVAQNNITLVKVSNGNASDTIADDEIAWTDEEIAEMLQPDPKTGAEIVALGHTGGWEHLGIEDSVEWLQEQRRKRREARGW